MAKKETFVEHLPCGDCELRVRLRVQLRARFRVKVLLA